MRFIDTTEIIVLKRTDWQMLL